MKALTLAVALLIVAAPAYASDGYPTKPDEMDKLCEVIGEAPNLSVPPKDRLWFKETCVCAGKAGCGNVGSNRFTQRLAAATAALEAKAKADAEWKAKEEEFLRAARAEEAKKVKAAQASKEARKPQRMAYWRCLDSIIPGVTPSLPAGERPCDKEIVALEKACGKGVPWAKCMALEKGEAEALAAAQVREKRAATSRERQIYYECLPKQGVECTAEQKVLEDACWKVGLVRADCTREKDL